jgi:hypothetical protein
MFATTIAGGQLAATAPDVCKTIVGTATVPVPYPATGMPSGAMPVTKKVFIVNAPALNLMSKINPTMGDQPGASGGGGCGVQYHHGPHRISHRQPQGVSGRGPGGAPQRQRDPEQPQHRRRQRPAESNQGDAGLSVIKPRQAAAGRHASADQRLRQTKDAVNVWKMPLVFNKSIKSARSRIAFQRKDQ